MDPPQNESTVVVKKNTTTTNPPTIDASQTRDELIPYEEDDDDEMDLERETTERRLQSEPMDDEFTRYLEGHEGQGVSDTGVRPRAAFEADAERKVHATFAAGDEGMNTSLPNTPVGAVTGHGSPGINLDQLIQVVQTAVAAAVGQVTAKSTSMPEGTGDSSFIDKEDRQRLAKNLLRYDGTTDTRAFKNFFRSHASYVEYLPLERRNGPAYVHYIKDYLDGPAREWFDSLMVKPADRREFEDQLRERFYPTNLKGTAKQRLRRLKFTGNLNAYTDAFNQIVTEIHGDNEQPFAEEELYRFYLRGLGQGPAPIGSALENAVATQLADATLNGRPTTLAFAQKAARAHFAVRGWSHDFQPRPPRQTAVAAAGSASFDQRGNSPRRGRGGNSARGRGRGWRGRGQGGGSRHQPYSQSSRYCFVCGDTQHMASYCPQRKFVPKGNSENGGASSSSTSNKDFRG